MQPREQLFPSGTQYWLYGQGLVSPRMDRAQQVRQILTTRGLTLYRVSQHSAEIFGHSSRFFVPREQLVRAGQRRSLMRRALIGVVPDELLNRKRKAFVVRASMAALSRQWDELIEICGHMVIGSLGIVDPKEFSDVLQRARHGKEVPTVTVMRTLGVEFWLKHVGPYDVLRDPASGIGTPGLQHLTHGQQTNPQIS